MSENKCHVHCRDEELYCLTFFICPEILKKQKSRFGYRTAGRLLHNGCGASKWEQVTLVSSLDVRRVHQRLVAMHPHAFQCVQQHVIQDLALV